MSNYYYHKSHKKSVKSSVRFIGILLFTTGLFAALYTFFPILSWQLYFAYASSENLSTPIPKRAMAQSSTLSTLLSNSKENLKGIDYTNAQNWFPTVTLQGNKASIEKYTMSIQKLNIQDANVSTVDYDLSKHLVNYPGTPTPGDSGNSVIFGHSSLPQLFNQKDYTTIFATLYKIKIGDDVTVNAQHATYTYKIFSVVVTDPTDTSIFEQTYDTSYITLVTCTPPGTTWKRLIVKGRLEKI